jgi:hypothetical protein
VGGIPELADHRKPMVAAVKSTTYSLPIFMFSGWDFIPCATVVRI